MQVKLKEIGSIITGKTPSTDRKEFWNGDICFITIEDLHLNKNIKNSIRHITLDGFNNIGKNNTINGISILVNCIGDIGKIGITDLTCATNQQINSITKIDDSVNPYFLYYKLQTMKDYLFKLSGETIIPILPKTVFENIKIDIPLKEDQDEIAKILLAIDNQIEKNNEMVHKIQVLGNTIYSVNTIETKKNINITKLAEPIFGICPDGHNIIKNKMDKSIKYASGAGDIDDDLVSINPKSYTNALDNQIKLVSKNDVCMSIAGTIGKVGIATEDVAIGRAMLGFRNNNLYGYLYFGLKSYSNILETKATGAIQKIINHSHLEYINLPEVSTDVINKLNLIVDKIIAIEYNTIKLENLKNFLLPLLINGQIKI